MNPTNIFDLLHYKIGYKIYSLLKIRNHPNIIIHGKKGSGKSLLVRMTFESCYSGSPIEQDNSFFRVLLHNNYYLFNCNCIINKVQFISSGTKGHSICCRIKCIGWCL